MKRHWLILLFFFISCTTVPQSGYYLGESKLTDGATYNGEWMDNRPHGQGVWTNKIFIYEGSMNYGKRHGRGTTTYKNGKWSGVYNDNVEEMGVFTGITGIVIDGQWNALYKNGYGTINYNNDSLYFGEWNADAEILKKGNAPTESIWYLEEPEGYGIMTYTDDSSKKSGIWSVNNNLVEQDTDIVLEILLNKYPDFKKLNNLLSKPVAKLKNSTSFTLTSPPENLTNIAVVDFNGNNISDGEVKALTDRLRAELFKTKHFKVIEREMMQEVMKEQGFQQSGCTTDECMVEIGRLIGVEKIIGGSISKVGNVYSVSSRIVNVETGEIEKSEYYDHIGEIGQLLTNGMREVAIGLIK